MIDLQKKVDDDCNTILKHLKDSELVESSNKQQKTRIKYLEKNLNKAEKLFRTTLAVKLRYEEVITSLC